MVKLGEVLRPIARAEKVDAAKEYRILGARWYAQGLFVKDVTLGQGVRADKLYRVQEGDFVYNRLFAWKGSFALASGKDDGCYVSNEFPCFVIDRERLEPLFLKWWFSRERAWLQALGLSAGATPTSRNRLKEANLLSLELPLPVIAEQRQVVARIEELAGLVSIARSLAEERTREADGLMASARREACLRLRARYADAALGTVCSRITDGPHVSPRYQEVGVPFLSVRNIGESGLDFSTAKYVSEADHRVYSQKAKVEKGDVLYTKGGTTGVARRVDTDREFSIWVHVALLKLNQEKAIAPFIEHMLNSPSSREQAELFTRGSSNRDLGLSRMANIVLPLPPLDVQERAAEDLDMLQNTVESAQARQREVLAQLDALLPALLNRAYLGEG